MSSPYHSGGSIFLPFLSSSYVLLFLLFLFFNYVLPHSGFRPFFDAAIGFCSLSLTNHTYPPIAQARVAPAAKGGTCARARCSTHQCSVLIKRTFRMVKINFSIISFCPGPSISRPIIRGLCRYVKTVINERRQKSSVLEAPPLDESTLLLALPPRPRVAGPLYSLSARFPFHTSEINEGEREPAGVQRCARAAVCLCATPRQDRIEKPAGSLCCREIMAVRIVNKVIGLREGRG